MIGQPIMRLLLSNIISIRLFFGVSDCYAFFPAIVPSRILRISGCRMYYTRRQHNCYYRRCKDLMAGDIPESPPIVRRYEFCTSIHSVSAIPLSVSGIVIVLLGDTVSVVINVRR